VPAKVCLPAHTTQVAIPLHSRQFFSHVSRLMFPQYLLLLPLQACCGRCLLTWHPWVSPWWLPPERWRTCGRAAYVLRWRAQQHTWCWIWS
jgi:hypothetical protein